MIKILEHYLVSFCRFGIGLSFMVLIVAVLIQVCGRQFSASPVWTEELTRFALIYIAAFGAGLSFKSGDLVNVDIICESLKGQWPKRMRLIGALLSALLCAILIYPAWFFVSIGTLQTSSALAVRMDFIHLSVFVLIVGLFIFAILRVIMMVFYQDDGLPKKELEDL